MKLVLEVGYPLLVCCALVVPGALVALDLVILIGVVGVSIICIAETYWKRSGSVGRMNSAVFVIVLY